MKQLHFSGIGTDENFERYYDITPIPRSVSGHYYFLSNDVIQYNVKHTERSEGIVFIGVANPHFFHALGLAAAGTRTTIRRIIAVDANHAQIEHFNRVRNLISSSYNRIEFIEKFFKVQFNARAIGLLTAYRARKKNYAHGGLEQDDNFGLEKELWKNLKFYPERFYNTYEIEAEKTPCGLKISANTIGDINTCYATIVCGSKSDYPEWPFTLGYGSGFLYDEAAFKALKKILASTPVYLIKADISVVYEDLLMSNRYNPIIFWSSNLLCDYFTQKHPPLTKLLEISNRFGTQQEPCFPESDLVLIQDERTKIKVAQQIENSARHKRTWSIHTRSFATVAKYLEGSNCLEIVNVTEWIEQDRGESKLPNTSYITADDFLGLMSGHYDSIVAHILVGHGVDKATYRNLIEKARGMTENLIVLEHNSESKDFRNSGVGVSLQELRDMLGMESFLEYCSGKKCPDRNIVCVYKRAGLCE
ncbi:MAG: hypothetical protein JW832_04580 [Deltaproteobacteria bacterium]|nr:hypothetical protein [Deltaproteobacteria bacterium]